MTLSLASLLNLRTEYEAIINRYKIPNEYKNSTIDSVTWFLSHGRKPNRLRPSYIRAVTIAEIIIRESKR